MKSKGKIAFIIEGPVKEQQIFDSMKNNFFERKELEIVSIPARQNLYMLWNTLKEDEFDTDILEVIKEYYRKENREEPAFISSEFQEIYLFFDYDGHQTNLPDGISGQRALLDMLETFDNETELGKLYISYPMVEAIKDIKGSGFCRAFKSCEIAIDEIGDYKKQVGKNVLYNQIKKYQEEWLIILKVFIWRIECLMENRGKMTYSWYEHNVTAFKIYEIQKKKYIDLKDCIFVLSAFPDSINNESNPSAKHIHNHIICLPKSHLCDHLCNFNSHACQKGYEEAKRKTSHFLPYKWQKKSKRNKEQYIFNDICMCLRCNSPC